MSTAVSSLCMRRGAHCCTFEHEFRYNEFEMINAASSLAEIRYTPGAGWCWVPGVQ